MALNEESDQQVHITFRNALQNSEIIQKPQVEFISKIRNLPPGLFMSEFMSVAF